MDNDLTKLKQIAGCIRDKFNVKLKQNPPNSGGNINDNKSFPFMHAPLEHYINLNKSWRLAKINDVITRGSVIVGRVSDISDRTVILDVIHVIGKRNRKLYDLGLEIQIPKSEFKNNSPEELEFFKVVITNIITAANKITINGSLNPTHVSPNTPNPTLGKYNVNEISQHLLTYQRKLTEESYIYDLVSNSIFFNSLTVPIIECKLGLDSSIAYESLLTDNLPDIDVDSLRNKQFKDCSKNLTTTAIRLIHRNKFNDAEKHLNNALKICPDSVDTIVAFGACKANQKLFLQARTFFARALEIEPDHKNAMNYLIEATISLAKSFESKGDFSGATQCYNDMLNNPVLQTSSILMLKMKEALNKNNMETNKTKSYSPAPTISQPELPKTTDLPKCVSKSDVIPKKISTQLYMPPSKRPICFSHSEGITPIVNNKKLKHFSSKDIDLLNTILGHK